MTDEVSPLLVLQARAEARAILCAAGELGEQLEPAVVPLLQYALASGIVDQIGAERAFAVVNAAFAELRTPPGEKPGVQGASKGTAASTRMHADSGGPHDDSEAAE